MIAAQHNNGEPGQKSVNSGQLDVGPDPSKFLTMVRVRASETPALVAVKDPSLAGNDRSHRPCET